MKFVNYDFSCRSNVINTVYTKHWRGVLFKRNETIYFSMKHVFLLVKILG
jgi:hypothetical protein